MACAALERLLALLFPYRCVLCPRVVEYDTLWCGDCPLPAAAPPFSPQGCLQGNVAAFAYSDGAQQAVLRLKTLPDRRTAAFLARHMYEVLPNEGQCFDSVVPVPMSPARRRERGYNQTELLARPLAERLGLPLVQALVRSDQTRMQHGLGRAERADNARRSYRSAPGCTLTGQTVLLVDDVYTTGSTVEACAQCLLRQGAAAVWAVTAARVAAMQEETRAAYTERNCP